ncbi:hypothetical protein C5C18_03140 [Rathayibacter tritici]|uniref:Uncharacterized protein n=1 Tax=Rathayibacter tritici TaxID=33888 RepID=A0A160KU99_9MICO|nr:hypothetical protein [Rathayibacter tritici]AND17147.1 hypothetical protein A6122_2022 [Rathayibacter tritici]PPF30652.1 hypothetical protein C5C06_04520 [Rathayibacter tritici]PPF70809.1 hypothetical protein C5C21_00690 [Rathayibacter tritici]PPG08817.1 hypothetical protein C5C18_03140 [Rathayibacter tritici]PPI14879.1 hypothetical protein C5D07_07435 [Rathayibacter tritici]
MTQHTATATLEKPLAAAPAASDLAPIAEVEREPLVRPADLVSALTGIALCFFSLFVFAIAHWQYFGTDVDEVSVLGWLTPLIAGVACVLVAVVSVSSRAAGRRAERSAA